MLKFGVSKGEEKVLPPLELSVAQLGGCDGHPGLDYIRFLPSERQLGSLGGSATLDGGSMMAHTRPVAGADVTLRCAGNKVCGVTRTNSKGDFIFRDVLPGVFTIDVGKRGYYPVSESDLVVNAGRESIYTPRYLERCPLGDCDPSRPKKPLVICE